MFFVNSCDEFDELINFFPEQFVDFKNANGNFTGTGEIK